MSYSSSIKVKKIFTTSNMKIRFCYFDEKLAVIVHVFTGSSRVCECRCLDYTKPLEQEREEVQRYILKSPYVKVHHRKAPIDADTIDNRVEDSLSYEDSI